MHVLKGEKIDGIPLDRFIEDFEEDTLYLIDLQPYLRGEMSFRVYDELSGLFKLWIDAAPRRHYDVMDILVGGGDVAIIHESFMRDAEIKKALEVTENIILKSFTPLRIESFLSMGGERVITSKHLAQGVQGEVYVMTGGEVCQWRS